MYHLRQQPVALLIGGGEHTTYTSLSYVLVQQCGRFVVVVAFSGDDGLQVVAFDQRPVKCLLSHRVFDFNRQKVVKPAHLSYAMQGNARVRACTQEMATYVAIKEASIVNTRPGLRLDTTRESNRAIVTHATSVTPHDSWMTMPSQDAGRSAPPRNADGRGREGVPRWRAQ